jgi:hypothetical protein
MKMLAVMTFAAATALATVPAAAESPARGPQGGPQGGPSAMFSQDDRAALTDARIAAIRAGLRLTEEQEALFEPVEEALRAMSENAVPRQMRGARGAGARREMRREMRETMRDMSQEERREMRAEMRERRGDRHGHDFMERLERRSEMASANAALMSDLTLAMRPFWDGLESDQQRLLPVLMQPNMAMGQHRHARFGQSRYGQPRYGHMGERGGRWMRGRSATE